MSVFRYHMANVGSSDFTTCYFSRPFEWTLTEDDVLEHAL